jgi:UDP-glucose 4-epimerase
MKCLVFGGAGFLGSYITERLVHNGHSVLVYESEYARFDNLDEVIDKIKIIKGNFIYEHNFDDILTGVDIVFHLICTSVPKTSNENILEDIDNNIRPTIRLLESCVKTRVNKLFYISSGGTVYGNISVIPIPEDHLNNPISAYGVHKLTIEKYIQLYNHLYGLDYNIARISNPYGPRQMPFKSQGVIATFMALAISNKTIELWGDGTVIRDFIYINDVIEAIDKIIEYKGSVKLFNIGYGEGISILTVIDKISKVLNKQINIEKVAAGKYDSVVNILDISLIRKETGWFPQTRFEDGLKAVQSYLLMQKE